MFRFVTLIFVLLLGISVWWVFHKPQREFIVLQSSTSTQNSGLYDFILPKFSEKFGIDVHVIAVGTGQALKNAQKCDGDLVIVHSQIAEQQFVDAGYGLKRHDLMTNEFVLIGPKTNPAGIDRQNGILAALEKVAATKALFLSRGDDSGTHRRELALWQTTKTDKESMTSDWYRETGAGQGSTINTAASMNAYTVTDKATWIAHKNKADLEILLEGDGRLKNPYGVIVVDSKACANTKTDAAIKFQNWLLSEDGQREIANYTVNGQQLFFPLAK